MGDGKEETRESNVHSTAAGGYATAAHYDKVRSGYTRESVEFLLKKVDLIADEGEVENAKNRSDPVRVLEVGSGTGKFTRVMLDVLRGVHVRFVASDPLESMYRQFRELLPHVEIMQCPAQNIDLPSSTVDVVLAAQSFHWFAKPEALAEINRVLVPGGRLGIIFNLPDESVEWAKELLSFYAPLYRQQAVTSALDNGWKRQLLTSEWFCNHVENTSFRLFQECSIDAAYAMFASVSVIANGSDPVKAAFRELFDAVIKTHFTDKGKRFCHIPYVTTMWWCTAQKN